MTDKKHPYAFLASLLLLTAAALAPGLRAQDACAVTDETPMVVTSDWLKQHIGHKELVLLHIGNRAEYDAGHIPGARYISLSDISKDPSETDLRLQLLPAERLREAFEKFGISNDSRIVLYYGKDWVTPTTRVYFALTYLGLGRNASLLDGGMAAWTAAGHDLTKEVPPPAAKGRLEVKADDDLVARADWLRDRLKDDSVRIVDARSPNYYDGSSAGGYPRPGHIRGAKNIPFSEIVDESNRLKAEPVLRKMFTDAGVRPYDTVVTYCHIGQQASLAWFAARLLGYKAKLYDGSYEEWSADDSLAVEDPLADTRGSRVAVVSPEWVFKNAGRVRILDVRLNVYDYFTGHVPDAVHLADAAMRGPREGYPTQYLESFMLGRMFSSAGIRKDDKVVVYSDGEGVLGATMMVYLLERLGHGEIYFLDGGFRDYRLAHPVAQEYPVYRPGGFDVLDNRKVSAGLEDVKEGVGSGKVRFIDARPPEVYRGETKIWKRNGHIPGAVNIPWKRLVEGNNPHKLKPAADLRKVFADAGIKPDDDIIVYCGTSREASLEYLVLKHILKFPKVRLYEGSWAEYSNHPELGVGTGAGG